jgi:all-trans-retinol dehydrogenase (NAD+)
VNLRGTRVVVTGGARGLGLAIARVLLARGARVVLVNNAGVVFGGPFDELPLAKHLTTVAVNLSGVIAVTYAFLPHLETRPRAAVLNISSASAYVAVPYATSYAASKTGVVGFSESLDEEMKERKLPHVRISVLCPNFISTGMFEGARNALGTWTLTPEGVAEVAAQMLESGEARRILPWTAAVLMAGFGWLPRPIYHTIARWFGVARSMADWRGRPTP